LNELVDQAVLTRRTARAAWNVLCLIGLACLGTARAQSVGRLVIQGPPECGVAMASSPLSVSRVGTNAGALNVTLSSSSPTSTFSSSPSGAPWTSTATVAFANGADAGTVYFRDSSLGTPVLTASAPVLNDGGVLDAGTLSLPVRPISYSVDFESGTLLLSDTPYGGATNQFAGPATTTLGTAVSAAHRGALGLRALDMDTTGTTGPEGELHFDTAGSRVRSFSGSGCASPTPAGTGQISPVDLRTDFGSGDSELCASWFSCRVERCRFNRRTAAPSLRQSDAGSLTFGTFHLFELALTGVGTATATSSLWVDGALRSRQTGINLTQSAG